MNAAVARSSDDIGQSQAQLAPIVLAMEQVRRGYGTLANRYIELFGSIAAVHVDDLALINRHLAIRPGTVLDAGCGPGHITAYLHSLDVDAMGIDLVPEFIAHARATYPDGRFELGSFRQLASTDGTIAGILAWYSLIHVLPNELDEVLAELRRALAPDGKLVVGFFDGDEVSAFEHKVVTAYYWPIDQLATRLHRAGFTEVERQQRPGLADSGIRSHAAIAAVAH